MIQNYALLNQNITEINSFINDKKASIQKIYTTARFLVLRVRIPGETIYLYIGRGKGYEGIWRGQKAPTPEIRMVDRLTEYCRGHIQNSFIDAIEIDPLDRILVIKLYQSRKYKNFFYFYSGRKSYFAYECLNETNELESRFVSWKSKINTDVEMGLLFDEIGRKALSKVNKSNQFVSIDELLENEKTDLKSARVKKRDIKRRETKITRIEQDLSMVTQWSKIQTYLAGLENPADLNLKSFNVKKLEKKIAKMENPFHQIDLIYKTIKKWKKAEIILGKRLEIAKKQGVRKSNRQLIPTGPIWNLREETLAEKDALKKQTVQDYQVEHFGQILLAFGLNARGNDQLRNHWAQKEDWWFHIKNKPSTHIYLRGAQTMTPEILRLIGSYLIDLSKTEDQKFIEVLYTQAKNIKGVKGKAGAVKVQKAKSILIDYEPDFRAKLMSLLI